MRPSLDELHALRLTLRDITDDEIIVAERILKHIFVRMRDEFYTETFEVFKEFYTKVEDVNQQEINEFIELYESRFNLMFAITANLMLNEEVPGEMDDVLVTMKSEDVDRLPRHAVEEENINCSICLEDIPVNTQVMKIPCNHVFHTECLSTWLKDQSYMCPLCRQPVGQAHPRINE